MLAHVFMHPGTPSYSQAALQLRQSAVNRLILQQKDIQRELSEVAEQDGSGAEEETAKGLKGKLTTIDARSGTQREWV